MTTKSNTKPATRSYGFRVTRETWASKPCIVVRVLAREGSEAFPMNPRSSGESVIWDAPKAQDGLMLDGLTIRAYFSDYQHLVNGLIIRPAEFENTSYVDAGKATSMLRTFRRIDREVHKNGGTEDLADYLGCVARAIGATWTVTEVGHGLGVTYSSSQWEFGHVSQAQAQAAEHVCALTKQELPNGGIVTGKVTPERFSYAPE